MLSLHILSFSEKMVFRVCFSEILNKTTALRACLHGVGDPGLVFFFF